MRIGLMTGAKWAELGLRELKQEIKGRMRGGAKNPHLSTFHMVRGIATRRFTVSEMRGRILAVSDTDRRTALTKRLDLFLKLFPIADWQPCAIPECKPMSGPKGLIQIGTSPHLALSNKSYRQLVALWNNREPPISARGAHIANLLMSCGTAPDGERVDLIQTIDLTSGGHYCIDSADPIDLRPLNDFLNEVEDAILSAA